MLSLGNRPTTSRKAGHAPGVTKLLCSRFILKLFCLKCDMNRISAKFRQMLMSHLYPLPMKIKKKLACVASVSSRDIARKLEREQKKWNGEEEGEGEGEGRGMGGGGLRASVSFSPLPLPRHSFFFFCPRPNVLDKLARKRLLRSLRKNKSSHIAVHAMCQRRRKQTNFLQTTSGHISQLDCALFFFKRLLAACLLMIRMLTYTEKA